MTLIRILFFLFTFCSLVYLYFRKFRGKLRPWIINRNTSVGHFRIISASAAKIAWVLRNYNMGMNQDTIHIWAPDLQKYFRNDSLCFILTDNTVYTQIGLDLANVKYIGSSEPVQMNIFDISLKRINSSAIAEIDF